MKTDSELQVELEVLRGEHRRLRHDAGPSRAEALARLGMCYVEAQQRAEAGLAQAAVDLPATPALVELSQLWGFVHDTAFREALETAITESELFGDEGMHRKIAGLEARIRDVQAELASRRSEREQKRAKLEFRVGVVG